MFKKFLTTIILSMLVVSSVFAQPPTLKAMTKLHFAMTKEQIFFIF